MVSLPFFNFFREQKSTGYFDSEKKDKPNKAIKRIFHKYFFVLTLFNQGQSVSCEEKMQTRQSKKRSSLNRIFLEIWRRYYFEI
ncbi:hypothetical protein TTHERM_00850540 (macronuclear) [Tetrahymena thermophila SB210]|uniref:Uncharacterized protein n=1 Tax=Tetrahymena thermophila (strain SB210) TaxID=312017 RepID=Q23R29_TETTS|nr:hypothetical protein TTHERM_00850540 [Tetrahymena thermophila SB210]EAR99012.1 hypothetical protein TTHERM_00850540 [Tetrahymena thermophila SB210]|eukprot:XP_001019257.1 hypothetical protein TTHERM_00850540 [Tetrahymena thermophila SB210]